MELKKSSGVGYRLPVPWHRSVQHSYLEVGALDGVWLRLTVLGVVVSGSLWAMSTLLDAMVVSKDWLFLSVALFPVR